MPKKLAPAPFYLPTVESRALVWERCIRTQRVAQKITAQVFSSRVEVSESTLRRMERGDPAVAMGSYLTALAALGLLESIVPMPDAHWSSGDTKGRARVGRDDDEYF